MESSQRGALGLVRLIAGCIIVIGLLDGGLYFTQYFMTPTSHHEPRHSLDIGRVVLDSLPIIVGVVILIKSKAIAEWLADTIDE